MESPVSVFCQTEVSACDFITKEEHEIKERYEKLKKEHEELNLKCDQLQDDNLKWVWEKEEIEMKLKLETFNGASFKNDNEKVRFFTGLTNWEILSTLFQFVRPHLVVCSNT